VTINLPPMYHSSRNDCVH